MRESIASMITSFFNTNIKQRLASAFDRCVVDFAVVLGPDGEGLFSPSTGNVYVLLPRSVSLVVLIPYLCHTLDFSLSLAPFVPFFLFSSTHCARECDNHLCHLIHPLRAFFLTYYALPSLTFTRSCSGSLDGARVWVIEVNPFLPTTDGYLFDWVRDIGIIEGRASSQAHAAGSGGDTAARSEDVPSAPTTDSTSEPTDDRQGLRDDDAPVFRITERPMAGAVAMLHPAWRDACGFGKESSSQPK